MYDVACFWLLLFIFTTVEKAPQLKSACSVLSLPLWWVAGPDCACAEPASDLTAPCRLAHFPRPPGHCCLLSPARGSALSPFLPRSSARKFSALPARSALDRSRSIRSRRAPGSTPNPQLPRAAPLFLPCFPPPFLARGRARHGQSPSSAAVIAASRAPAVRCELRPPELTGLFPVCLPMP